MSVADTLRRARRLDGAVCAWELCGEARRLIEKQQRWDDPAAEARVLREVRELLRQADASVQAGILRRGLKTRTAETPEGTTR